jgi:chemotaxis protein CheC
VILPDKYKDALTELINVAYGRAAASLSELTHQRISLESPKLDVYLLSEVKQALIQIYDEEVWSIHQVFAGGMSGHAMLLVDEKSATRLGARVLGESSADNIAFESVQEVLTEVGNIVLQASLGICGDLLHIQVTFSVPGLKVDTLGAMLNSVTVGQSELQYALMVRTQFQVLSSQVVGHMVVVLGMTSFSRLIEAVEDWEKRGLKA